MEKVPLLSMIVVFAFAPVNVATAAEGVKTNAMLIDLSGPWMSVFGPVTLEQNGRSVVGSFIEGTERVRDAYMRGRTVTADQWKGEHGSITDGTFGADGKTLVLKFHEPQSQLDGSVTLTLSSDGKQMEGPYSSAGMGGNHNGTWTMWRNKCGSAKYLEAC
jgi:hypothetical protein